MKFLKFIALGSLVGLTALNAAAPVPLVAPVIDTSNFTTIAGSVLAATGVFFGIRKALGLLWQIYKNMHIFWGSSPKS